MFYHPRIAKEIRGLNLDVIHTHTEFSLGIFGRSMAKALDIPVVHTMHTIYEDYTHYIVKADMLDPMMKKAAKKLSRYFCNTADAVIAPTDKVKDMLEAYGVQTGVSIIPTGIDLGKFSPERYDTEAVAALRREYGISPSDKVLLYIGRVSEEKNIAEVLHGLADYLPQHPDIKFLLVGNGPALESLQSLASELGIAGQVIFAGAKPWDQIGLYYQLGDAFVSASQSETQGLTYIEALAAGLPLIVKADRCLDEVLREGENGFSFKDANGFQTAMDAVLSDEETRMEYAQTALTSAHRFSAEAFSQAAAGLYMDVMGQRSVYVLAS